MRITLLIIVTAMTRKERPPDSTEQEDEPLSEIAGGFTVDSNASPHIHGKLACIINDSTSKKLVGDKVKELLEKYSRPKIPAIRRYQRSTLEFGQSYLDPLNQGT